MLKKSRKPKNNCKLKKFLKKTSSISLAYQEVDLLLKKLSPTSWYLTFFQMLPFFNSSFNQLRIINLTN